MIGFIGIGAAVAIGVFFVAFCVDYLFEMGGTARCRARVTAARGRWRQRRARINERRRIAALSPIEAMVDYKKQRRLDEQQQWFERWNELDPRPTEWDYAGQHQRQNLFSGNPQRIRRVIPDYKMPSVKAHEPMDPAILREDTVVQTTGGHVLRVRGNDIVEIRNTSGEVIVRY